MISWDVTPNEPASMMQEVRYISVAMENPSNLRLLQIGTNLDSGTIMPSNPRKR
jgi:hypothetical protein